MSVRQIEIEFGNIGFPRSSPTLGLGLSVVAEYVSEITTVLYRPEFKTPTSRKMTHDIHDCVTENTRKYLKSINLPSSLSSHQFVNTCFFSLQPLKVQRFAIYRTNRIISPKTLLRNVDRDSGMDRIPGG